MTLKTHGTTHPANISPKKPFARNSNGKAKGPGQGFLTMEA